MALAHQNATQDGVRFHIDGPDDVAPANAPLAYMHPGMAAPSQALASMHPMHQPQQSSLGQAPGPGQHAVNNAAVPEQNGAVKKSLLGSAPPAALYPEVVKPSANTGLSKGLGTTGASGSSGILTRRAMRDAVTMRDEPVLAGLTLFLSLAFVYWAVVMVVLVSMKDQLSPQALTVKLPTQSHNIVLQILTGPLGELSRDFYYSFGHEAIDVVLATATCWAAVIHQTRQLRATAVFATTWVVFSWLIYTRYIFQGLSNSWEFCEGDYWENKWCRISKANGVASVLMELGKIGLMIWAWSKFASRAGLEPYCEMDVADLERMEVRKRRNPLEVQHRALSGHESIEMVSTVPLGLAKTQVPSGHVPIASLRDCRVDTPGKVVLGLCALSVLGFILCMLSNIPQQMLDNQNTTTPTPLYVPANTGVPQAPVLSVIPQLGDLNYHTNMVFTGLLLFFAVGLSVAAAYDRVRETSVNPLMLTLLSSMAMWTMFLYSARRIILAENTLSIDPQWDAQVVTAVGLGIITCAETLRFFALIWKFSSCPAVSPVPGLASGAHLASHKFFALMYHVLNILMFVVLFAYMFVLMAIECTRGLFQFPMATYATGQYTPEDALVFPYQVFVVSLLITGWVVGMNFYATVRSDRVGNFTAFATILVQCAGWWLMNWSVVYAYAFKAGPANSLFCGTAFTNAWDGSNRNDLCHLTEAAGRIGLAFFIVIMLNMLVAFARWAMEPRDTPLMEQRMAAELLAEAQGIAGQGVPASQVAIAAQAHMELDTLAYMDPHPLRAVTLAEEASAHRAYWSFGLLLSLAGWTIWAAASSEQATRAYWMPAGSQLYPSLGFDLYVLIACHYITLSFLVNTFVQVHLATHPALRRFHYFFRVAHGITSLFSILLLLPVVVYSARQVAHNSPSAAQGAQFVGMCIMIGGECFNFLYGQIVFSHAKLIASTEPHLSTAQRHHLHQQQQLAAKQGGLPMTKLEAHQLEMV